MHRALIAEALGTALLLAIVVGSGIMGARLSGGNAALALLGNSLATGAGLIVLIQVFGPLSGAHFNPAVTLVMLLRREIGAATAAAYAGAQGLGAILGVWITHLSFAEPMLQISTRSREGWSQGLAEAIATFGLVVTILSVRRTRPDSLPAAIGLYIVAAYWFTASTSFANPAVTIARSLTDSFAGIAPASVPLFIAGQLAGAIAALLLFDWLYREHATT